MSFLNFGPTVIPVSDPSTFYHLYHSAVSDYSRYHDIVITLSANANAVILEWDPISECPAPIHLKDSIFDMIVVAVYAATLESDCSNKDGFYSALQDTVQHIPLSNMLIIDDDWNAQAGKRDG